MAQAPMMPTTETAMVIIPPTSSRTAPITVSFPVMTYCDKGIGGKKTTKREDLATNVYVNHQLSRQGKAKQSNYR